MKPNHDEIEVGATQGVNLRVSVATYDRVIFPHPDTGTLMLALERKATAAGAQVHVRAQPLGGGVRILDPEHLQQLIGEIEYDSERSRSERDFRILIPPARWDVLKQYCLQHLADPADLELESAPDRELSEEFAETMHVHLTADQYTIQPAGFVIEEDPLPTRNTWAPGQLTVRLYRIFEVRIVDEVLCTAMLARSQRYSDEDLAALARRDQQHGGRGRANSILTLPLASVVRSFRAVPAEERFKEIVVDDHTLDESVLAVLGEVEVPQYKRL